MWLYGSCRRRLPPSHHPIISTESALCKSQAQRSTCIFPRRVPMAYGTFIYDLAMPHQKAGEPHHLRYPVSRGLSVFLERECWARWFHLDLFITLHSSIADRKHSNDQRPCPSPSRNTWLNPIHYLTKCSSRSRG